MDGKLKNSETHQNTGNPNRLTQVISGSQVSSYEYDADGRMLKKVDTLNTAGTTLYVSEDYEVIWSAPQVTATTTYTHKLYFPMMANSTGWSADNALVRATYRFNGQPIAVREGITLTAGALRHPHRRHTFLATPARRVTAPWRRSVDKISNTRRASLWPVRVYHCTQRPFLHFVSNGFSQFHCDTTVKRVGDFVDLI